MARDYKWPDSKRIAVAVTAMLETWSDGKGPPYGVQASPHDAGLEIPRPHFQPHHEAAE